MKRRVGRLATVLVIGLALPLAAAESAPSSWDRMKSLVGTWRGTFEGKPAQVSYVLVSDGTALMETLESHDSSQMVTVYHPDGSTLLMTHYCSIGNQSRMRAQPATGDRVEFALVDATNLGSADQHRMTRLVLTFREPDHLVQEWTAKSGNEEHVGRFEFTRKR
jgi:hypothetical protein